MTFTEIRKRKRTRTYKGPVTLHLTQAHLKDFLSECKRVRFSRIPKQAGYIAIIDLGSPGGLLVGKLGGREAPPPPTDIDDPFHLKICKTFVFLLDGPCNLEATFCPTKGVSTRCVGDYGRSSASI